MIMRPGYQLLLPASPVFIWGSLLMGVVANALLNFVFGGHAPMLPDVLAVVLVFWTVHQPLRVGIAAAFVFGVVMDVQEAGLLGAHAMAYSVLSFLAIVVHRRLLWFSVPYQALQVLPLFVVSHLLLVLAHWLVGVGHSSWWVLVAPVWEALLWLPMTVVLLAPQRRAPDPDADRPL